MSGGRDETRERGSFFVPAAHSFPFTEPGLRSIADLGRSLIEAGLIDRDGEAHFLRAGLSAAERNSAPSFSAVFRASEDRLGRDPQAQALARAAYDALTAAYANEKYGREVSRPDREIDKRNVPQAIASDVTAMLGVLLVPAIVIFAYDIIEFGKRVAALDSTLNARDYFFGLVLSTFKYIFGPVSAGVVPWQASFAFFTIIITGAIWKWAYPRNDETRWYVKLIACLIVALVVPFTIARTWRAIEEMRASDAIAEYVSVGPCARGYAEARLTSPHYIRIGPAGAPAAGASRIVVPPPELALSDSGAWGLVKRAPGVKPVEVREASDHPATVVEPAFVSARLCVRTCAATPKPLATIASCPAAGR